MRNNLTYFNVSDTNYLILYKPDNFTPLNQYIYGFTKNEFIVYKPQKVTLKNFPSKEYINR
jgi:hypothetical protein